MKNNLKRILLLLPVISVLLVVLAVPVFANGVPDVTSQIEATPIFLPIGDDFTGLIEYLPGETFAFDNMQFNFRYRVTIDVSDAKYSPGDVYYGAFLVGPIYADEFPGGVIYFPCDKLFVNDSGFFQFQLYGTEGFQALYFPTLAGATEVYMWFQEWPLTDISSVFYELPIVAVDEVVSPSDVEPVTSVFTDIMTWITSALTSVMGAFYVDGSLTLLGTLAVIGVSVGIGFLIIGLIQRFLHLRG